MTPTDPTPSDTPRRFSRWFVALSSMLSAAIVVVAGAGIAHALWIDATVAPLPVNAGDVAAPPTVACTPASPTSVDLTWTATPTAAADGYQIGEATGPGGPYTVISTVALSPTAASVAYTPGSGVTHHAVRATRTSWTSPWTEIDSSAAGCIVTTWPGTIARWDYTGGSLSPAVTPAPAAAAISVTAMGNPGPAIEIFGVMNNNAGTLSPDDYGYPNQPQLRFGVFTGNTTPTATVANGGYFEWTVTAPAGPAGSVSFNALRFDAARGGTSTPRGLVLRTSADGYATNVWTSDIPEVRPTMGPYNIDLSTLPAITSGGTLTFRMYLYAPGRNNTIEIDQVELDMDVTG